VEEVEKKLEKKSLIKKAKRHLQLWSGIWSVPLAALIFVALGLLLQAKFGEGVGFYDPSFLQAAFLGSFILILFNSVSWFIFYFSWRHLFKYYLSQGKEDFDNLKRWQKILLVVSLHVFYIVVLFFLVKMLI
jgi:hypothetical protein